METTNNKTERMKQQEFIDILKKYIGMDPTEENAEDLANNLYNVAPGEISLTTLTDLATEFLKLDGKKKYYSIYVNGVGNIVVPRPENVRVGPKERILVYPKNPTNIWLVGYREEDAFYCPTSMHSKDNESLVELDLNEYGELTDGQCYGYPPNEYQPEPNKVFEAEKTEEDIRESWMVGFLTEEEAKTRLEELKKIYTEDLEDIEVIPTLEILPAKIYGPYFKIVESWGGETNEVAFYQLGPV